MTAIIIGIFAGLLIGACYRLGEYVGQRRAVNEVEKRMRK